MGKRLRATWSNIKWFGTRGMNKGKKLYGWRESEGEIVTDRGQIIAPIPPEHLPPYARALVERSGRAYITRNSKCPCGSQKRFKRCCMMREVD